MYKIERLDKKPARSPYRFQSDDDRVGQTWEFATADEVKIFFWGRDVSLYRVEKDGRDLGTPGTGDLEALVAWLEQA